MWNRYIMNSFPMTVAFTLFAIVRGSFAFTEAGNDSVALARWKLHKHEIHLILIVFLSTVMIFKMLYHKVKIISATIPESFILIILGVAFGALAYEAGLTKIEDSPFSLKPTIFFDYLLPPIILDASYTLYHKVFAKYFSSILLYAMVGTILNFFLIGFAMYGLYTSNLLMSKATLDMELKDFLLFASLIVAVDPVAVLAIFQSLEVDLGLYYIVFGESLLNDAVTVVLYDIMVVFVPSKSVSVAGVCIGILSFITISGGGFLIGIICGVLTCLLTRFENQADFLIIIFMAYFSYIFATIVGWSGIIAMITCGIIQKAYAFHNIRPTAVVVVKEIVKQSAGLTEAIIFLFLGIQLFSDEFIWESSFHVSAMLVCLISRFMVIFFISYLINKLFDFDKKISYREQIIIVWGGLRGAVAYSLVALIQDDTFANQGSHKRELMTTATLLIILMTVGVMGITMKPLVKLLKIDLAKADEMSLLKELNKAVTLNAKRCIDIISTDKQNYDMKRWLLDLDEKYIRRILQRVPAAHDQKLLKTYQQICFKLHQAHMDPEHSPDFLDKLPEQIKKKYTEKICQSLATDNELETSNKWNRLLRQSLKKNNFNMEPDFEQKLLKVIAVKKRALQISQSQIWRQKNRESVYETV